MAANIQDRSESTTAEIARILRDSRVRWLTHDESLKLFENRHLFTLSLTVPGPTPRRPGLFLFDADLYSDDYVWDRVRQAKRKNCFSDIFPDGDDVRFTVARRSLQGGGAFLRRTHHAREVHPTLALVHYRLEMEIDEDSAFSSAEPTSSDSSESPSSDSSDPDYVPEDESLPLPNSLPMKTRKQVRSNRHDEYPGAIRHFGPMYIKHFTLQIKRDPHNPQVYNNRSLCFLKLGRVHEALLDAETALVMCPSSLEALRIKRQVIKDLGREADVSKRTS